MKKLSLLIALILFAAPLAASAYAGAQCFTSTDTACDKSRGEFCNLTTNACELNQAQVNNIIGTTPSANSGGFVPLAPIPGVTDNQPQSDMVNFLNNLYKILIGLAAAAAVIEIIWGGFEYATQDNISKKSDGRHRITQALLGLALILMPVLVFSIINPQILNLGVSWQAIKPATPSNYQAPATITQIAQCNVAPLGTTTITAAQESCCTALKCDVKKTTNSEYCDCTTGGMAVPGL